MLKLDADKYQPLIEVLTHSINLLAQIEAYEKLPDQAEPQELIEEI